jgi:hypothetical protein
MRFKNTDAYWGKEVVKILDTFDLFGEDAYGWISMIGSYF